MSIADVSRTAGVSMATVSRVLNRHPHVSSEKMIAVKAAIQSTGYAPRGRHQRESIQRRCGLRTGQIAVLFPDVNQRALYTRLSGRLLHGIENALQRRGLTMVVTSLAENGEMPPCVARGKVDGVIVRNIARSHDAERVRPEIPAVWMFQAPFDQLDAHDAVLEDNHRVAKLAVDYFADRGHRKLAVIDLKPWHPSLRARRLFFEDEAAVAGLQVRSVSAVLHEARSAIEKLMSSSDRPSGLFVTGGDDEFTDVHRVLLDLGLRHGREVDVLPVNHDAERLATIDPLMANIDIRSENVGSAAVDLLLWRLEHPTEYPRGILISPVLQEPPMSGSTVNAVHRSIH
jgi:LacI family transcriptional regulator